MDNITGELAQHGYSLAIQQNKKKSGFSTSTSTTSTSTTSNLTHGKGQKQGSESGNQSGSLSNQGGSKSESEQVVSEKDLTQSGNPSTGVKKPTLQMRSDVRLSAQLVLRALYEVGS